MDTLAAAPKLGPAATNGQTPPALLSQEASGEGSQTPEAEAVEAVAAVAT
jgi:hypothetical protein